MLNSHEYNSIHDVPWVVRKELLLAACCGNARLKTIAWYTAFPSRLVMRENI